MDTLLALLSPHAGIILLTGTGVMALTGWWCQMIRYPAFRSYLDHEFVRLHAIHTAQISVIVVPGMMAQMMGTWLLVLTHPPVWLSAANIVCVIGSILPTFLVSGPIHGRLSNGKNDDLIEKLIQTNLPRTVFWTLQFFLALVWMGISR